MSPSLDVKDMWSCNTAVSEFEPCEDDWEILIMVNLRGRSKHPLCNHYLPQPWGQRGNFTNAKVNCNPGCSFKSIRLKTSWGDPTSMLEEHVSFVNSPSWWSVPGRRHLGWLHVEEKWERCWPLSGFHKWRRWWRAGSSCPPPAPDGFRSLCSAPPGLGLRDKEVFEI